MATSEKDPNRPPEFDATNLDDVAAYIEKHGLDAFRTERHRQTGYTETVQKTASQK